MTWPLLAGVGGLAILDSFNPATLIAITLILLGSRGRPIAEAVGFVAGAFLTVFVLGSMLFLAADAASTAIDGAFVWIRRGAFGLAAVVLLVTAIRSLRPRYRKAIGLPAWFSPSTAVVLGVVMTAADLPNAFPYFIAIERLVDSQVSPTAGLLVLAGYAVIYCLPCLALLALGLAKGERVQRYLASVRDRFSGEGVVPASPRRALLIGAAALVVGTIAVTA